MAWPSSSAQLVALFRLLASSDRSFSLMRLTFSVDILLNRADCSEQGAEMAAGKGTGSDGAAVQQAVIEILGMVRQTTDFRCGYRDSRHDRSLLRKSGMRKVSHRPPHEETRCLETFAVLCFSPGLTTIPRPASASRRIDDRQIGPNAAHPFVQRAEKCTVVGIES